MKIQTTRFGEIEVNDEDRLEVIGGLMGFAELTRYVLHRPPGLDVFAWLQSEEVPQLAFVVCSPRVVVPDYHIDVSLDELAEIDLRDDDRPDLLVVLAWPHDPARMTANLLGPVVVNPRTRKARQLVLASAAYSARHKVFPHLRPRENTEPRKEVPPAECAG